MTDQQTLLAAIVADPADGLAWLALADWLEEDGQPLRAELLRLTRKECTDDDQRRIVELLAGGVRPCVPEFTDPLGMRFALVPAGRFVMGSAHPDAEDNETPHEVAITRPFWLGVFPVTQDEYTRVTGENPSGFRPFATSGSHPVENVSWDDARAFCMRLNDDRRLGVTGYRLPSEAE